MNNTLFSQSLTVNVRMRRSEKKGSTDGHLVLQIIIGRKPDRIPLKITWPLDKFDEKSEELLPRFKGDNLCSDYNLLIGQALAKANDICIDSRLSKSLITHQEFKYRFQNFTSKDLFVQYIIRKAKQRMHEGVITKSTSEIHLTSANRWARFSEAKNEDVSFSTLSKALVLRFRNWMRDEEMLEHNSIVTSLKVTKNYCRHAAKDKYYFDHEVFDIKTTFRKGRKIGLNKEEVHLFKEEYKNPACTQLEKECLRKFLFMIYTGLRISDANRVTSRHINNGQLDILAFKTQNTGKKVYLSLTPFAQEIIKGRKGVIFEPVIDQLFNKTMKRIASRIGILKTVSAHVARYTFARFLYSASGNLKAVSDLLGHASIRTTELYLQLDDEERGNCMKLLEEL